MKLECARSALYLDKFHIVLITSNESIINDKYIAEKLKITKNKYVKILQKYGARQLINTSYYFDFEENVQNAINELEIYLIMVKLA